MRIKDKKGNKIVITQFWCSRLPRNQCPLMCFIANWNRDPKYDHTKCPFYSYCQNLAKEFLIVRTKSLEAELPEENPPET